MKKQQPCPNCNKEANPSPYQPPYTPKGCLEFTCPHCHYSFYRNNEVSK